MRAKQYNRTELGLIVSYFCPKYHLYSAIIRDDGYLLVSDIK